MISGSAIAGRRQGENVSSRKRKTEVGGSHQANSRQVESIDRSLASGDDCADVLMLLANVRGGINRLMAEVLEDHIRLHMLSNEKNAMPSVELVRAYLK